VDEAGLFGADAGGTAGGETEEAAGAASGFAAGASLGFAAGWASRETSPAGRGRGNGGESDAAGAEASEPGASGTPGGYMPDRAPGGGGPSGPIGGPNSASSGIISGPPRSGGP
jgi:hypothetical protein